MPRLQAKDFPVSEARCERIGNATLYLGDARDHVDEFADWYAVVTDPPYGIGYVKGKGGKGCHSSRKDGGDAKRNIEAIIGDDNPFDPKMWLRYPQVIMWGANHFASRLPDAGRWLAWNKLGGMEPWDSFSDVEFAWCSLSGADRIFSHLWKGLCQKGAGTRRDHPTQKPVELMEWCLSFVDRKTAFAVVDPYMGSGTTGEACVKAGIDFVGIECVERYFDIACRRIEQAQRQRDLFIAPPSPEPARLPDLFAEHSNDP